MLCQLRDTVTGLLWGRDRITKYSSWALVLSSLFLVGELLGFGIRLLSVPTITLSKPSIALSSELPPMRTDIRPSKNVYLRADTTAPNSGDNSTTTKNDLEPLSKADGGKHGGQYGTH